MNNGPSYTTTQRPATSVAVDGPRVLCVFWQGLQRGLAIISPTLSSKQTLIFKKNINVTPLAIYLCLNKISLFCLTLQLVTL